MSGRRPAGWSSNFGRGVAEKPVSLRGSLVRLFRYMRRYRVPLIAAFIFSGLGAGFSVIGPALIGQAITIIFEGVTGGGIDIPILAEMLIFLTALYLAANLLSLVGGHIMVWITQKATHSIRMDLSSKIHRLPMASFEHGRQGELLSIFTNDMETISQAMQQSSVQLISNLATIIGVLAMMLYIDWAMTLVVLLVLPPTSLFVVGVVKNSQKHFSAQQKHLGMITGRIEEQFSALQVVQAFGGKEKARQEFNRQNEQLYKAGWKSQFFSSMMFPIVHLVSSFGFVAVGVAGAIFAATGRIPVGAIQAFLTYTRNFTHPISQLAQITAMLQSMAAAAERVFAFLDREEEQTDFDDAGAADISGIVGQVRFEHVCFGYTPQKMVINDFSAQVDAGKRVAIVGHTGAGKTTIVKLLLRFYELNSGDIFIDGRNIREFGRKGLRQLFGMVLQDTWLFSGSIMENIRYGKPKATDEEVISAAKAAYAHHFIMSLPGGYDLELEDGAAGLSGGQRQLLTIARAFLAGRPLLILDEATSSVDTRTEALIQAAMGELMKGRTCFVIAHRLSTIKSADTILVMESGNIVEQGSHEQLIGHGGVYTRLWNSQFS